MSYAASGAGVTIDLVAGTGLGGDAQGDTLLNIENVTGSAFADILTGDAGVNILLGNDGNDTLVGGGGADSLDGGVGNDGASYDLSSSGVTIDLSLGTASGGDAQGDILQNIESLQGSAFADNLTGDDNVNTLIGLGGNDVLNGLGGRDFLRGGSGTDTLNGGSGDDVLFFNAGDTGDFFNGGTGSDILDIDGLLLNLTLSTLHVTDIEFIDLLGTGPNSLTLTLQDVVDVTDSNDKLIIKGDANDTVISTGEGWTSAGTEIIDGEVYNVYTVGTDTLLVDTDITQINVT